MAVVAVVALAACGDPGAREGASRVSVVAALDGMERASYRFAGDAGPVDGGGERASFEGAADRGADRSWYRLVDGDFELEQRVLGDTVYWRSRPPALGTAAETWSSRSADEQAAWLSGLFDPESLLGLAREETVGQVEVGDEEVRGAPATRYRLSPKERTTAAGETLESVEVWIDQAGHLRRLQTVADTPWFGRVVATVEYYAFGEPVPVEAPTAVSVQPAPEGSGPSGPEEE